MFSAYRISILVGALLVSSGCTPDSINQALDTACDNSGCISLKQFSANIDTALKGKVVGYISAVGSLPIISIDGQARTSADAPAHAWDTDIRINIASLSKTLTTIGVLQSLAEHGKQLDSKIAPYLPPDWVHGPNIDAITFRELLTHSAGFRNDGDGSHTTYDVLQQQISDGVQAADMSAPSYNNLNFAIFRVLLPYMEGFSDPGPATRAMATSSFYISYMQQHVFQPVGVTDADCKPGNAAKPALSYPPPPIGATHGIDWGDWTLACGGGGWVLSVHDLYLIMLDLLGGNTLLTDTQKMQMNTGCLGWDCSVMTQTDYVGKNGILQTSNLGLWTFLGIFKGTVPVVVLVNSNTPANITSIVANAFANATVPHP